MEVIDSGKLVEEVKKKDPNVDVGKLFAEICYNSMIQKSTYIGSRALTESEVPKGLEMAVREYFSNNIHNNFKKPFELKRLERANMGSADIYAVPKGIYEEIFEDDNQFDEGLREVGKKFGVSIDLPWYCNSK